MKPGEEQLLTDLAERGIKLIPSATAQLASRSKVFQTRIFSDFLLPLTRAIYDHHSLLQCISLYQKHKVSKVVLKRERKNGGLGIHLFSHIEDIYNLSAGGNFQYPFVIQPFQPDSRDIRVILLDDYHEAYERNNSHNFRNNLHCGGKSTPYALSRAQLDFCRIVMKRGKFPYGHIDLLLSGDNNYWLSEINLRGGLKGAKITLETYREKILAIQEKLLEEAIASRQ
jgi:ribosomal protein S6--L-glutamate ligase